MYRAATATCTWLEDADPHVQGSYCHDGDDGKVPADDKHDGHTQQSSQQSHPLVVVLECWTPA